VLSVLAVGRFSKHRYKHDSINSVWQTCVTTVTRHLDRIRCEAAFTSDLWHTAPCKHMIQAWYYCFRFMLRASDSCLMLHYIYAL